MRWTVQIDEALRSSDHEEITLILLAQGGGGGTVRVFSSGMNSEPERLHSWRETIDRFETI